jgi:hypothetical protein
MMQEARRHSLDDQLEAIAQVVAGAAVESYAVAIFARDGAEAVVLDLVQPIAAGRRLIFWLEGTES